MRDELPGFSIRRKAVTIGKSTELLMKFRWGLVPGIDAVALPNPWLNYVTQNVNLPTLTCTP